MTQRFTLSLTAGFLLVALLAAAGCGKKKPAPYAAPYPVDSNLSSRAGASMGAPEAILEVEPASILQGEKALLTWSTENATTARISPAIGVVDTEGSREVAPTQDTVYTLSVEGPGGVTTATARVSIVNSGGLPTDRSGVSSEDLDVPFDTMVGRIRDVYFDYDASGLHPEMEQVLVENGRLLMDLFARYPSGTVLIEGHCDERGTNEYNLALGDRRAQAAKDFLVAQGVPADRMRTVSLGEERPQCFEPNESCYGRNRRAHFTPMP
jgi:peptidoglycan-associated lipoprotein